MIVHQPGMKRKAEVLLESVLEPGQVLDKDDNSRNIKLKMKQEVTFQDKEMQHDGQGLWTFLGILVEATFSI